jgi:hypothetical protein
MPTILIPHDTATGYVSAKSGIRSLGIASGLTGATAASRYAGATASGAPASGTFLLGDWTIDQTGAIHVCSTAGTAGSGAVFTRVGGTAVTAVAFAESTASPNATVNVDSITAAAPSPNADLALVPKGAGALTAAVADGTMTSGNKRGNNATDWQRVRSNATEVASGLSSVISGGSGNTSSNQHTTVGGGTGNTATGQRATIAGGWANSATNTRATIGGGDTNTASSGSTTIAGGYSSTATATYATVGGGWGNNATALSSTVSGGTGSTASGYYATVPGGVNAVAATWGKFAYAGGRFATSGDAQYGLTILRGMTTILGTAQLTADGAAAGLGNVVNLAANRAFLLTINLVASDTAVTHTVGLVAVYSVLIRCGAAAANTVVVDQTQHTLLADASILDAVITVSADTDYGGLNLTVTGSATTDLRWVATVQSAEVG